MAFWESMPANCWNPVVRVAYRSLGWVISAAIAGYLVVQCYDSTKEVVGINRDAILARYARPEGVSEPQIYVGETSGSQTKAGPGNSRSLSFFRDLTPEQKDRALKVGLFPEEIIRIMEAEVHGETDPFIDQLRGAGRLPPWSNELVIQKVNLYLLVPLTAFILLGTSLIIQNVMAAFANSVLARLSFFMGRRAEARGDDAGAIAAYRRTVVLVPYRSGGARARLGLAYERAGRYAEAQQGRDAATDEEPRRRQTPAV